MRILAFSAIFLAVSLPSIAQPVISVEFDPYRQLDVVDSPWELSEELQTRLAALATEYEAATGRLEVHETQQRVKYPRSGKTTEGAARDATFVLTLDDGSLVPIQGPGRQLGRSGKLGIPAAHAWTQLFASHNQPYFGYRDLGEVPYAYGKARKIQFRGSIPFDDGTDIRQWEGTILVDSFSLLPVELDAQQLNLWPRLEHQRDRYMRSFKFGFFGLVVRFKKRPIGQRLHVRFDRQEDGLVLPVEAYVEKIEKVSPAEAVVRARVTSSYEHRMLDGVE